MQKTNFKEDDEYVIEKTLKTKGNNIFVKWSGYSNNFNSWVNKSDIKKIFTKKPCH